MSGIVVLISGRGSNLQAIYNSKLAQEIQCVISNQANALGLKFAQEKGLITHLIESKLYPNRHEFEQHLAKHIDSYSPRIIVLAGFMRILSQWFVNRYAQQIINIHPSILPAFIGTNAPAAALKHKIKVSGATVHFVTNELDHGPIIAQGIVPVYTTDNLEELTNRILGLEHVIYPFVLHKILAQQVNLVDDRKVMVKKEDNDAKWLGPYRDFIFY